MTKSSKSPSLRRLERYADPSNKANWRGAGRDQKNIDRWSERASRNSEIAPRAAGDPSTNGSRQMLQDPPKVPPNGGRAMPHSTEAPPRRKPQVDAYVEGRKNLNHTGGSFVPKVRRTT